MIRGALSHLDLTVSDPEQSVPFYDAVLSLLGYRRMPVEAGTTAAACWSIEDSDQSVFSIALEPVREIGAQRKTMTGIPQGSTIWRFMSTAVPTLTVSMPSSLPSEWLSNRHLLNIPTHLATMRWPVVILMASFWSLFMNPKIEGLAKNEFPQRGASR